MNKLMYLLFGILAASIAVSIVMTIRGIKRKNELESFKRKVKNEFTRNNEIVHDPSKCVHDKEKCTFKTGMEKCTTDFSEFCFADEASFLSKAKEKGLVSAAEVQKGDCVHDETKCTYKTGKELCEQVEGRSYSDGYVRDLRVAFAFSVLFLVVAVVFFAVLYFSSRGDAGQISKTQVELVSKAFGVPIEEK